MPARTPVRPALAVLAGVVFPFVAAAQPPFPVGKTAFYQTVNFQVAAADEGTAKLVAERAEECRKALALDWLGRELPAWGKPCPVRVAVTFGPPGGASRFKFGTAADRPTVTELHIDLFGPLEVLLKGVLPHEVMHCVVTSHFGKPLPRWADEGVSILVEPADVQAGADAHFQDLRTAGRALRLKALTELTDYPVDPLPVYLGGHSVVRFLLTRPSFGPARAAAARRKLLVQFLAVGMARGWDQAAKAVYGFADLNALEAAWADWLQTPAGRPAAE